MPGFTIWRIPEAALQMKLPKPWPKKPAAKKAKKGAAK
jgi:hypothetical protein